MIRIVLLFTLFFALSWTIVGQKSFGGYPYSLHQDFQKKLNLDDLAPFTQIKEFSDQELVKINEISDGKSLFAFPYSEPISLNKKAKWIEHEGRSIFVHTLEHQKSTAWGISFKQFNLPKDGQLFIYNENLQTLGVFTQANNNEWSTFFAGMIAGQRITIEYSISKKSKRIIPFEIDKIYRIPTTPDFAHVSMMTDTGFGASFDCHKNIACNTEIYGQVHQKAVMRILVVLEEGLGLCTGSLVNNTSQDETPYILSAFHCMDGFTPRYDLFKFDFNFQAESCAQPGDTPGRNSLLGSEFVAGRRETDFLLIKLTQDIPASFDVYFNGWDRTADYHPEPSYLIHHPWGDIKKIASETDEMRIQLGTINWDNNVQTPREHHFVCDLDDGTHEPGSSGGPVLDQHGRIIGQLHGGVTDSVLCDLARSYIGRFTLSWGSGDSPQARLQEWLDPLGDGTLQLDGFQPINSDQSISIQGQVLTPDDQPVPNVSVTSEDSEIGYMTDVNGNFTLSVDVTQSMLHLSKNTTPDNGLSAVDIVLLRQHILGLAELDNPYKVLAADANENESLSVIDLLMIQNLILGNVSEFPNRDSWGIDPPTISLNGTDQSNLNITAFKIGDLNFSADPGN